MRRGISTFAYSNPLEGWPNRMLDRARRMGAEVIQFGDNAPLTRLSAAELDDFLGRAQDEDVHIETGTRGLDPEDIAAHLSIAQRSGSSFVRLVIDRGHDEPTHQEAVERLTPIVSQFRSEGKFLAIENHDRFRASEIRDLVHALGPDAVGVCLDTANSLGALEGLATVVPILAPYVLNLHAKDVRASRSPDNQTILIKGCQAGTGQIDFPWVRDQLAASPHPWNVILEMWWSGAVVDEERSVERSFRYLRSTFSS